MIDRITAAQRVELEQEISELQEEASAREKEIEELVGTAPVYGKTRSETLLGRPAARRHSHAAPELAGEVPF